MTRLLGSVLVAGAALWGWQRQRAERRRRMDTLWTVSTGLSRMAEAIRLERTPMPRLLELSRDALACVVGPSATICAPLLDAGADLVAGSVVADAALAREVVTCGAPLHGSGALEHVLVATPRGRAVLADQL